MKGDRREAAHVWHLLDRVLPQLRQVRDDFEAAGLEDEAQSLQEVLERAEVRYEKVEREVARLSDEER